MPATSSTSRTRVTASGTRSGAAISPAAVMSTLPPSTPHPPDPRPRSTPRQRPAHRRPAAPTRRRHRRPAPTAPVRRRAAAVRPARAGACAGPRSAQRGSAPARPHARQTQTQHQVARRQPDADPRRDSGCVFAAQQRRDQRLPRELFLAVHPLTLQQIRRRESTRNHRLVVQEDPGRVGDVGDVISSRGLTQYGPRRIRTEVIGPQHLRQRHPLLRAASRRRGRPSELLVRRRAPLAQQPGQQNQVLLNDPSHVVLDQLRRELPVDRDRLDEGPNHQRRHPLAQPQMHRHPAAHQRRHRGAILGSLVIPSFVHNGTT